MTPVTSVGIANGMSTIVERSSRPRKWYRTITYAISVPKITLITAVRNASASVRMIASFAPGASRALRSAVRPFSKPFVTTTKAGSATRSPR